MMMLKLTRSSICSYVPNAYKGTILGYLDGRKSVLLKEVVSDLGTVDGTACMGCFPEHNDQWIRFAYWCVKEARGNSEYRDTPYMLRHVERRLFGDAFTLSDEEESAWVKAQNRLSAAETHMAFAKRVFSSGVDRAAARLFWLAEHYPSKSFPRVLGADVHQIAFYSGRETCTTEDVYLRKRQVEQLIKVIGEIESA